MVVGATLVALALAAYVVRTQVWLPVHRVTMPSDDASPKEVVKAYVAAMDGHDCATASRLMTYRNGWCPHLVSVDLLEVHDPFEEAPDRVDVGVELDLHWKLWSDGHAIMPGRQYWGYILERQQPGGPWRIVDEGTG